MADPGEPLFVVDGQDFKAMIYGGLVWLRRHQEEINALNVFPVPDGDTGTNMVLTMQSAWEEVAPSSEKSVSRVAHLLAQGSLMGARGNSGVILSQIWRGLARSLDGKEVLAAADLAAATEEGVRTAYKGVIRPVEGTILTVAREIAEEVARAVAETENLTLVWERMVHRGWDALARTPQLLSVLAEAGVVDAGGQGLCVILEGMLRCLRGEAVDETRPVLTAEIPSVAPVAAEGGYGYDVQFIIVGQGLDVDTIRQDIDAMGESTLVVGDPTAVKVHVHVPDPGRPLSYAVRWGSLRDVVVEDMQAQYQEFVRARERLPAAPSLASSPAPGQIGVIAVAAGEGFSRVFASLGAAAIVPGGQTMNPSTEEILQAVESIPNEQVIILPNNRNIILAAQQVPGLTSKRVVVVPTRTVPQGIAALLALNYQADLERNGEQMSEAAGEIRTGEVTTATRDVTLNGVAVRQGQAIGLLDEQLVVADDAVDRVVEALLERMDAADMEIITLYYGADVQPSEAEALVARLREKYPEQEIEIVEGGQPYYDYIISAE